ncbi:DUF4861 family protein [Paraferrimonas sp. SM1919]|uniref:DUF4861 family protein n=1 Tax=Paraferrimonas sp. SM1919 TaxID=2662263 RepID=UPI0013D83B84|nr:DUF4861 family protein [Paraferrimonas sp. SM1919]
MKHQKLKLLSATLAATLLSACGNSNPQITLINSANFDRNQEIVEVSYKQLNINAKFAGSVVDSNNNAIAYQHVDTDFDGQTDAILFQADIAANASSNYALSNQTSNVEVANKAQGMYVKERADDFAWENDRIAYRMYGPAMTGMVHGGIDVWTKSVDENILEHWYTLNSQGQDYHVDRGQGLDFYHVGKALGPGGTAIMHDGKLVHSDVYADWKIINPGPLRVTFELSYKPFDVAGTAVSQRKIISLDKGTFLSHFTNIVEFNGESLDLAYGIYTHNDVAQEHKLQGLMTMQWQGPYGDNGSNGELGTAVIALSDTDAKAITYGQDGEKYDPHHLYVSTVKSGEAVSYLAGAGWSKSKYFSDAASWYNYVESANNKLAQPIEVSVKL